MCPRGFAITEIAAELLHSSNKDNTDDAEEEAAQPDADDEEAKVEDDNDPVNTNVKEGADKNNVDNNEYEKNNVNNIVNDENVVDNKENDTNNVDNSDNDDDVKITVVPPPFIFKPNLTNDAHSSTSTTTTFQPCAPLGKCLWHQVTTLHTS